MSHITKVETRIADLDVAEQALTDLGVEVARDTELSGWMSRTGALPLACLRLPSGEFGIGLRQTQDGTYEALSDWWYVERHSGIARDDFLQRLYQRYSYLKVKKALDEHGFRIAEESVDAQQSIRLEVVKWR